MTVVAAEAGASAAEAGAAEASTGAGQAFRSQGRRPGSRRPRRGGQVPFDVAVAGPPRQNGHQPSPARGRTGQRGPAGQQGTPGPAGGQGRSQRRARPQLGGQPVRFSSRKVSHTNYQSVILAEFVAAILLVAATPFAKKGQPASGTAGTVSPYVGSDLLQLVAITLVYFILALASGASRSAGRFSAWFGGLILLAVGLGEAARLASLFGAFGLTPPAQAQPSTAGTPATGGA